MNSKDLLHRILSDMRVELTEEFDRNFERKAFFTDKWKKRANPNAKGSLLIVTGTFTSLIMEPRNLKFMIYKKTSRRRLQVWKALGEPTADS